MNYDAALTGNTRYKVVNYGWFNKPIVAIEVEEIYPDGSSDSNGMPEYLAGKRWRLATPTDMLRLPKI